MVLLLAKVPGSLPGRACGRCSARACFSPARLGHLVGTESVLVHTPCKMPLDVCPHPAMITAMSDKKRWRELMKALQDASCEVTRGKGGHYRVHQGPRLIASLAATASDHRSYLNTRAQIRRQGIKI